MNYKIASSRLLVGTRNDVSGIELRKFGFSFGLGLNLLGCIMFYRHRGHFIWFSGIGSASFILAILYPAMLAPLKKVLDKLIVFIGRLTGLVSLSIVFYLIFTPIALLFRFLGKDLLNEKINRKSGSYWIKREESVFSKESYERMG